ncbi:alkaline phosphatase [Wenyingzhuangia fucanilytica]|uniref:Alkaline phosphatase n=1 Tax=Wenyingzhuangia fucanilytica TaxID=1790137 RepID=A0A1B1Y9I1_9FLAO|nr:choice-of-anchor I family protein [Wenyingzhuangia fucanilytica]ANW97405.1 alkaline phosphatase [Wenyingzhuangia fucanilytica]
MKKLFKLLFIGIIGTSSILTSCSEDGLNGIDSENGQDGHNAININQLSFTKIGTFTNGNDEAYSEISAFDPTTNKLFIVNPEENEISVLNLTDATAPSKLTSISLTGSPNSVAVHNGILAVAVENNNKQANGTIETYNTNTQVLIKSYTAGALPDMVTFSPDGKYILSANEGEPNDDYTIDPEGSITVVEIASGTITQIDFTSQSNPGNGFRIFGNNGTATLQEDIEPEYITISDDSKTAYVVLQENNGMAVVDLETKTITSLVGLGTKNYNISGNEIDASDKDGIAGNLKSWNVLSFYMPDAIDYFTTNGNGYIVSANEGDARDYGGYSEEERVKDLSLDPATYPNASWLQEDENLGRLKITTANGDENNDGLYEQIYGYGGRSFSIWNTSGQLVYDSGSEISRRTLALAPSIFNQDEGDADGRSDDKGAEPEAVKTLKVGDEIMLFVGLERTSGILVYNITNPLNPEFITWLYDANDIAPEGLIVVDKTDSPTGNYLMIATHEVSSTIAIYEIK